MVVHNNKQISCPYGAYIISWGERTDMISKSKYNGYKLEEEILDKEWGRRRGRWGAILNRVIRDSLTDSGNTE